VYCEPEPLPEHARTEHQPFTDDEDRANFTLSGQISDFRAKGCKPVPTETLHKQSGLLCDLALYRRFLGVYLREQHPDLTTGPRRIYVDGRLVQRRCLCVAPTAPLLAERQAIQASLEHQIRAFRETFCTPILAINLWRAAATELRDKTTRHKYLHALADYVRTEQPDLELRNRRLINPRTHKPFATPWLVSRDLPQETAIVHDERGMKFELQIRQTREILGNGKHVVVEKLWEQNLVDTTFLRYKQALTRHLSEFHPDLEIHGESIRPTRSN
jgi:hypothetical protein